MLYLGTRFTMGRQRDDPPMTRDMEMPRRQARLLVDEVVADLAPFGVRVNPFDRSTVAQLLMSTIPMDDPAAVVDRLFLLIPERAESDDVVAGVGGRALARLRRADQRRRKALPAPLHEQRKPPESPYGWRSTNERRESIRRLRAVNPDLTQKQLAARFHVSASTICRDLQFLQ